MDVYLDILIKLTHKFVDLSHAMSSPSNSLKDGALELIKW